MMQSKFGASAIEAGTHPQMLYRAMRDMMLRPYFGASAGTVPQVNAALVFHAMRSGRAAKLQRIMRDAQAGIPRAKAALARLQTIALAALQRDAAAGFAQYASASYTPPGMRPSMYPVRRF